MTRILPRLLAQLQRTPQPIQYSKLNFPRKSPRSLHRPVPLAPSFHPSNHQKSILLHDPNNNPITRSRVYIRHKTLPPLPRRLKERKITRNDKPRPMTRDERQFWSNPYLRMLASPIRQCTTTGRFLPNDFLIRLAIMRLPPSLISKREPSLTFIPDGLQHSKFTVRRSDRATYILCSRRAVSFLSNPAFSRRHPSSRLASPHALLASHIAHLLRLRVLQELELLADALEAALAHPNPKHTRTPTTPLLRRLTHSELHTLRTTHTIPHPGALAVLIVPPLQKDPKTGSRPEPCMSPAPPPPDDAPPPKNALATPGCVMYPVRPPRWAEDAGEGLLPEEKVPLYNGVPMFPDKGQRAALHALLRRVLAAEGRMGHVKGPTLPQPQEGEENGKENGKKGSHAFLLCADSESVVRGDTPAVAIALWRLGMFEDSGEAYGEDERRLGWEWTRAGRVL